MADGVRGTAREGHPEEAAGATVWTPGHGTASAATGTSGGFQALWLLCRGCRRQDGKPGEVTEALRRRWPGLGSRKEGQKLRDYRCISGDSDLLMGHTVRNPLTGPNSLSGHGDRRAERGFNDGLAGLGVWWAGTPGEFGPSNLPRCVRPSPGSSLAEYCRVHILSRTSPKPVTSFLLVHLKNSTRYSQALINSHPYSQPEQLPLHGLLLIPYC